MNDAERASRASKELRETEAAFDGLRAAMAAEILDSQPFETAKRESLYLAVRVLDDVRKTLYRVVDSGLIEDAVLSIRTLFNREET